MTEPINNGWTIARSALLTHQHRITVAANNIANINTPGYARRDVLLASVQETPSSLQETRTYSNGVGVRVADVVRAQNTVIQNLLRKQSSDASGHETRATALANLEAMMNAGGASALNTSLDAFWSSWSDLANQADNMALRNVVVQRGVALATNLNGLHDRISSFEEQVISGVPGNFTGQLPADVDSFNQLTSELQDLNARISYSLSSFDSNGLMDRRETVLGELSKLADVTVGSDYSVTLDGQTVVSANGAQRAELEVTGMGPPATFAVGGNAVAIASGGLAAWSDVLDIAAGMRDRLDTLATTLRDAINSIHNSDLNVSGDSYDLMGERSTLDFFVGTGAADLAVNAAIYDPSNPMAMNVSLVAAAASRYDAGPPPVPNPGDGARALEISDMANQTFAALGEQTLGGYNTTGATLLGSLIQTERALADDGTAIVGALEDALQSEIGVNMEEELMDMLQAQRAFDAAGRLLKTFDELMLTLLQL